MKRFLICLPLTVSTYFCYAQVNHYEGCKGAIKAGLSYVKDFPGLNGTAIYTEYVAPITTWLEASVGAKRIQNSGYPRTATVQEYTRATTIDFNLFLVPVTTEKSAIKLGLGYSSSFYHIRRAYPAYGKNPDTNKTIDHWETLASKGRSNGITVTAEYTYFTEGTLCLGARIQYANAYQYVFMAGPFAAVKF